MTDTLDAHQRHLLERASHLHSYALGEGEVAQMLGISAGRLSQLKNTDEYKEMLAERESEGQEQQHLINKGWSAVEEQSLAVVLGHVKSMQENSLLADPDYALRAATLANKRQTRTSPHNVPLEGGHGGSKVINLTLSRTFVQAKVEGGPAKPAQPVVNLESAKVTDVMNVGECQTLLATPPKTNGQDVQDAFETWLVGSNHAG